MNICMIGTGYVGLVAGTCLADFGMNVICVDKDTAKIEMLNRGEAPIYELGLVELIRRSVNLGRLRFETSFAEAVDKSSVIFIAVGTPEGPDGCADLHELRVAAIDIARSMREYKIIAIKSTVPVGTAREIKDLMKANLVCDVEFDVVSNPEFLREGAAVNDFLHPDRIILGCESEKALAVLRDLYRPLYLLETPIINTSNETAELIKYAANTMLALRISFINEVANLCDRVGADVYQVAVALGMDKRIGPKFLHPGPGFGGSCFPKDVRSLDAMSKRAGYRFRLAEAIMEVNARQREAAVGRACEFLGGLRGRTVCLLGLSFKPNTDDIREAPAMYIAKRLLDEGAVVNAFDPVAMCEARRALDGINYFDDSYSACEGADLLMITTEWNEFRELDFVRIREKMRTPKIYDTRNIYNPAAIRKLGFSYLATGRPRAGSRTTYSS